MAGLLDDPQKLTMLMSGLGLLTSKTRNQADRWKEYGAQGLLAEAQNRRKMAQDAPMNDLNMQYKQAQLAALQNPTPDQTSAMQNFQAAGVDLSTPEGQKMFQDYLMKPAMSVNVGDNFKMPANYMPNPEYNKNLPVSENNTPVMPIPKGPADPSVKQKAKYDEQTQVISRFENALDSYQKVFDKTGTKLTPGADKMELVSSYKNLLLEAKELFNLGVLNGPDLVLMEQYLQDPSTIEGNLMEALGGREGFKKQLALAREKMNAAKATIDRTTGNKKPVDQPATPVDAEYEALKKAYGL